MHIFASKSFPFISQRIKAKMSTITTLGELRMGPRLFEAKRCEREATRLPGELHHGPGFCKSNYTLTNFPQWARALFLLVHFRNKLVEALRIDPLQLRFKDFAISTEWPGELHKGPGSVSPHTFTTMALWPKFFASSLQKLYSRGAIFAWNTSTDSRTFPNVHFHQNDPVSSIWARVQ